MISGLKADSFYKEKIYKHAFVRTACKSSGRICRLTHSLADSRARLLAGNGWFWPATDGKLPDRPLDVEFQSGHLREQIDIVGSDRAAAESHVGRHQVERLEQRADILQDKRIGNGAVFP